MSDSKMKVFAGNAHQGLAKDVAAYLGIELGLSRAKRFADGETQIMIDESVRGADIYIVQPTAPPVNENLIELLIMIDAMKRASANRITAVIPYYGYARQERKARARDPISAKLVANLITAAGADRVVAMDLHAAAIQGFFDIPLDHMPGMPFIANYYKDQGIKDLIVVSPDVGGVARARSLADRLDCEIAIIDKNRPAPNVAQIMNIIGNVKGKNVIMADDIIDTAGTITKGAEALIKAGAISVRACCTHGLLSGPAIQRLEESCISEIVVTNTIPQVREDVIKCKKIKVLSVAPLIGEAIRTINENLSISRLFV